MAPTVPSDARSTELQKKDQFAWSVQSLCDSGIKEVPKEYVRPVREEYTFPLWDEEIPVINYAEIQAGSAEEVAKFVDACENWGFFRCVYASLHVVMSPLSIRFPVRYTINLLRSDICSADRVYSPTCGAGFLIQLANHGISEDLIVKTQHVAKQFFYLPPEDKKQYIASNPDSAAFGYGRVNYLTDEGLPDWGDSLAVDADSKTDISTWPNKPEHYRETVLQYSKETTILGSNLLNIITRSLGLPEKYVETNFGEVGLQFAANFYPRCPQPDLVLGLSPHSDPQFITLLLQDMEGLHVLRDERWILVKPRHNHFVVNVGDQIDILSNGKYKSALHRVVVNNERDRHSLAAFLRPSMDAVVGPAPQLIDESHPPKYKTTKYEDFLANGSSYGYLGKGSLDSLKL